MIALRGATIVDETAGSAPVTLPSAPPCRLERAALAFPRDGSAIAIVGGRVYFRPDQASAWTSTPVCTDLGGQPWARRQESAGWGVIARRVPDHQAALLLTDDRTATVGWYAASALDATMSSVVLEGDGSIVALVAGGHMILVDRSRSVAGGVAAAGFDTYAGLSHTGAGVAAFRDPTATTREVVLGTTVQADFRRVRAARPAGPLTESVFVSNFGQLVAITDRGLEVLPPDADTFVSVGSWPGGEHRTPGDAESIVRASANAFLGWLPDGSPLVATRWAVAAPRCAEFAPATQGIGQ